MILRASTCSNSESTPGQSMTFHALVHAIFAPFLELLEVSTRLIVKGPDVTIVEKSVTGLALLLHELATNAVKCGSLSSAKGCVRIEFVCVEQPISCDMGGERRTSA